MIRNRVGMKETRVQQRGSIIIGSLGNQFKMKSLIELLLKLLIIIVDYYYLLNDLKDFPDYSFIHSLNTRAEYNKKYFQEITI